MECLLILNSLCSVSCQTPWATTLVFYRLYVRYFDESNLPEGKHQSHSLLKLIISVEKKTLQCDVIRL